MQRCRGPNLQTPEQDLRAASNSTLGSKPPSAQTANPEKSAYLAGLAALLRKNIQPLRSRYAHASEPTYLPDTPRPNDTVSVPTCTISCSSSTKKWSMLRRASASVNVATADSGDACASASRQGTRNPRKLPGNALSERILAVQGSAPSSTSTRHKSIDR